jgi:hypothetical protein
MNGLTCSLIFDLKTTHCHKAKQVFSILILEDFTFYLEPFRIYGSVSIVCPSNITFILMVVCQSEILFILIVVCQLYIPFYIDGSVSVRYTFYIDSSVSGRHTF